MKQPKAREFVTLALFAASLSLQAAGLQPAVKPCCAMKLNPRKGDAVTEQKRKLPKAKSDLDQKKLD